MSYKWALLAGASAMLLSTPAIAQTGDAGSTIALEEIVVTAQKREQNLQSVPVAVSAVSGEALESRAITQVQDLDRVSPSLTVTSANTAANSTILIRGIGTFAFSTAVEPSVAVVVDDLAVLQQAQAFSGLSDIERVEILRGPQGTLFGKNASAGAVNIVTRAPSRDFGGTVSATATSDEQYRVEGSVTGPLGERAAFRVNGYYNDRAGFIQNLGTGNDIGGEESWGLRGRLNVELTDNLTLDLIASRSEIDGGLQRTLLTVPPGATIAGAPLAPNIAGITPGLGNDRIRQNLDPTSRTETATYSARVTWDLGFASLISITGYQTWDFDAFDDVDALAVPQFGLARGLTSSGPFSSELLTQELRLVSSGDGPLSYVLGLYYGDGETERSFLRTLGTPLAASWTSRNGTESYAVFGQGTYDVSERLHVDLGLRYNNESIDVAFTNSVPTAAPPAGNATCLTTCRGSASESRVTGKLALRYDLMEDVMAYASFATGYKGQGFDISTGFTPAKAARPVSAEDSDAWEIGLKSRFWDGRAQMNIAVFRTDYDNFQAQSATVLPNGAVQFNLNNVGKLRTQGVEVEGALRATESLLLSATAAYIDAEIRSFPAASCYVGQTVALGCVGGVQNLGGRTLPNAPRLRYTVSAAYEFTIPSAPFSGFINADYRHQSDVNFDLAQNPATVQSAYGILDLSAGIKDADDRYRVTAFVKNVFDEAYAATIGTPNQASLGLTNQSLPRDYRRYAGVRVNYNF